MLSRRIFTACGLCSALGLVASAVEAGAQTAPPPGVVRKVLGTTEYPGENKVAILMTIEVPPNAVFGLHTHPGIESSVVMEGEMELDIAGQPTRRLKAGEGFQVAPGVPHGGRNGPNASRIAATFIVEKDKPLASPA